MGALVIIPARLASTRLPRKLLLKESGKFLLQHVYERAVEASHVDRVVIATDTEEIAEAARSFGATAIMTSAEHKSGTDRVAEAVRILIGDDGPPPELVVNVQGDEPELDPVHVDRLIDLMAGCDDPMGTLAEPIDTASDLTRPSVVKVVVDTRGRALYFSRSPIPHGVSVGESPHALRHIGLYAYRPAFLQGFCALPPAPLERIERLEQLRALFHGHSIRVAVVKSGGARGIDTREDYDAFLARLGDAQP
jgi:3-deoxy-manno-octulosonate cytidylyltransferase (CMP-KDO synthetase)